VGIDERHRIALHEAAKQTWGPEVAVTLMEMLPANGWADMATKSDLDRFATKSDLDRFATKSDLEQFATKSDVASLGRELRAEMTVLGADLRASMERSLRTQLMWMVTTMIALVAIVAAISGLTD